MEFETIPSQYKKQVLGLYRYLHKQKFSLMEKELIKLIEQIINNRLGEHGKQVDNVAVLILIYSNFNGFFSEWLKHTEKNNSDDLVKLQKNEHHNLLIAHCSDPSSMDDLLWEVTNYLEDPKVGNRKEAENQLAYYKKSLL